MLVCMCGCSYACVKVAQCLGALVHMREGGAALTQAHVRMRKGPVRGECMGGGGEVSDYVTQSGSGHGLAPGCRLGVKVLWIRG